LVPRSVALDFELQSLLGRRSSAKRESPVDASRLYSHPICGILRTARDVHDCNDAVKSDLSFTSSELPLPLARPEQVRIAIIGLQRSRGERASIAACVPGSEGPSRLRRSHFQNARSTTPRNCVDLGAPVFGPDRLSRNHPDFVERVRRGIAGRGAYSFVAVCRLAKLAAPAAAQPLVAAQPRHLSQPDMLSAAIEAWVQPRTTRAPAALQAALAKKTQPYLDSRRHSDGATVDWPGTRHLAPPNLRAARKFPNNRPPRSNWQ